MEKHEQSSYAVAIGAGLIICAWVIWRGEGYSKAIGAGLMLGSALFLFVGFFAQPKYEFGQFSIVQNALRVSEKLNELDEMHHKQIYGQRIRGGSEQIPSEGRLRAMLKADVKQICIGIGIVVPEEATKEQMIEMITQYGDEIQ